MRRKLERGIILCALLLCWAAALWRLAAPSLWYDELFNADLVFGHDLRGFFAVLRYEQPYPPLYLLCLKGWAALLGARPYAPGLEAANGLELVLRFPSAAASALLLAALVPLARRLRLPGTAALPLALAWHPTLLWYAREARMYAPWMLWVLLAVYALAAERRGLWLGAATAALLTHYFSVFPLACAIMAAFFTAPAPYASRFSPLATPHASRFTLHVSRFTFHASRFTFHALPFVFLLVWGLFAARVTFGFESFGTSAPPTLARFLMLAGPELLTARETLAPLGRAVASEWGIAALAVGAGGLLLLAGRPGQAGKIVAGAALLGLPALFIFAQLRPVGDVRYLVWALPLLAIGFAAWPTCFFRAQRSAALLALLVLALPALGWGGSQMRAVLSADRRVWYPDFRFAVDMLNRLALPGDRGVALAAHGMQTFTTYRTAMPFTAGPAIGARLRPEQAAALLTPGARRQWLLLYQDEAVDPGGVLVGTLEAAGGRRVELLYSRELRLYAYALPAGAQPLPLQPQATLDTTFAGGVVLRGWARFREERLLSVYLFWELLAAQPRPLIGAVHLAPRYGEPPVAQQDKPVLGLYWTLPELPVGERWPARYELILPPELPPGEYALYALLYEPDTFVRRALPDGADFVLLGVFTWP